jgi:hypothetical protein
MYLTPKIVQITVCEEGGLYYFLKATQQAIMMLMVIQFSSVQFIYLFYMLIQRAQGPITDFAQSK